MTGALAGGGAGRDVVLAVDVGTSGVRAVAVTERLTVVGTGSRALAVAYDEEGGAEQPAPAIAGAVMEALGEAARAAQNGGWRPAAAALSVTASALLLLHEDGESASPVFLWADTRAREEAREVRGAFGSDLYRRTGCPVHASYLPAKLRRRQRVEEGSLRGRRISLLKDYVLQRLTGHWAVDWTVAAASGLLDSERIAWDEPLLVWLGVEPGQLPPVVPPLARFPLSPEAAAMTGLPSGLPVMVGSMDGMLAHIGLGCIAPGAVSSMFGSSAALRVSEGGRRLDPRGRMWCYPVVDGLWVAGGASNNGGNVMEWLSGLLGGGEGEDDVASLVALGIGGPPGARGLTFLPYLLGERSPLWNEDVSGCLHGLRAVHRRADVVQAVLEGLCFGLYEIYRGLRHGGPPPERIVASGGYTRSPGWVQMQADVFGVPVAVTGFAEVTAMGAAVLAWHGLTGRALSTLAQGVPVAAVYRPDPQRHKAYEGLFQDFLELRRRVWPELEQAP